MFVVVELWCSVVLFIMLLWCSVVMCVSSTIVVVFIILIVVGFGLNLVVISTSSGWNCLLLMNMTFCVAVVMNGVLDWLVLCSICLMVFSLV